MPEKIDSTRAINHAAFLSKFSDTADGENLGRAYLDLTQQLADARALLEASAAHIWDGARELILNRGVEVAHARARLMEDATKRVRDFLAHTKGQNE